MSLFLVLLTFAVLIILDLVKSSRRGTRLATSTMKQPRKDEGNAERYYHPGHLWVLVRSSEEVTVGVDDFAQRVVGRLSSIKLPEQGTRVQQGQPFVTLRHGEKTLTQVAPVSGVVREVNSKLMNDPTIVNSSPIQRGWIAKIVPTNLEVECRNLLRGISAAHWEEAVRNQLIQRFLSSVQPVLQDGGMIADNISDLLSLGDWEGFVNEFFPNTATWNDENKTKN